MKKNRPLADRQDSRQAGGVNPWKNLWMDVTHSLAVGTLKLVFIIGGL